MMDSKNTLKPGLVLRAISVSAFLLFAALGTLASAQTYWYESYDHAVHLIDQGKTDEAFLLLEQLIERYPAPETSVRVPGNRFMTYAPYYQRGRIEFARKDFEAAYKSFQMSKSFGSLSQSPRVLDDLENMLEQATPRPRTSSSQGRVAGSAKP